MNGLRAIIIFSILIIVHEFGHFIAARFKGIKVEKFAIGFGPPLFKRKIGETLFLVCIFPLGGYVKMAGDERSQCSGAAGEFFSKSAGERSQVVFAGPLFNYLLAFVIFWFFAFLGFPSSEPVVGKVLDGKPAQSAGIRAGDRIVAVNDEAVNSWTRMAAIIHHSSQQVDLTIEREGELVELTSGLEAEEGVDELGRPKNISIIGITPRIIKHDAVLSFLHGGKTLFVLTGRFFKGIGAIILGIVPFKKAAIGPLGIYFLASQAAQSGILAVLQLMAVLSLSLALINLFPIPVLDGGHIALFLLEKVRKRQLTQRTEELLNRIGLALLGALFIFVFYNDIKRGPHFQQKDDATVSRNETVP